MSRDYFEYADARIAKMDSEGQEASRIFNNSYAIGEALASARAAKSMTQQTLASRSGVDQGDISRIERGSTAPTTATLSRLADALDARIAFVPL